MNESLKRRSLACFKPEVDREGPRSLWALVLVLLFSNTTTLNSSSLLLLLIGSNSLFGGDRLKTTINARA